MFIGCGKTFRSHSLGFTIYENSENLDPIIMTTRNRLGHASETTSLRETVPLHKQSKRLQNLQIIGHNRLSVT